MLNDGGISTLLELVTDWTELTKMQPLPGPDPKGFMKAVMDAIDCGDVVQECRQGLLETGMFYEPHPVMKK